MKLFNFYAIAITFVITQALVADENACKQIADQLSKTLTAPHQAVQKEFVDHFCDTDHICQLCTQSPWLATQYFDITNPIMATACAKVQGTPGIKMPCNQLSSPDIMNAINVK